MIRDRSAGSTEPGGRPPDHPPPPVASRDFRLDERAGSPRSTAASRSIRRAGERPEAPRLFVVPIIVALNAAVFVAWQFSPSTPRLRDILSRDFLVSAGRLHDGAVWTIVTSVFSHGVLWHLLLNMFVLVSFGAVLERIWGWRRFAVYYLVSGSVASIAHCAVTSLVLGKTDVAALGASGALAALLMSFAMLFPRHRVELFHLIPVPAIAAAVLIVLLDVWGLIAQGRGGGLPIGHGAHLGGAAAGVALWWLTRRSQRRAAGRGIGASAAAIGSAERSGPGRRAGPERG